MIKFLLSLMFISISNQALAVGCKVYGISDSPQKLQCNFHEQMSVHLSCNNRSYFLTLTSSAGAEKIKVKEAYHLEVEEGNNPLVFESRKATLTVLKSGSLFKADLISSGRTLRGKCI